MWMSGLGPINTSQEGCYAGYCLGVSCNVTNPSERGDEISECVSLSGAKALIRQMNKGSMFHFTISPNRYLVRANPHVDLVYKMIDGVGAVCGLFIALSSQHLATQLKILHNL